MNRDTAAAAIMAAIVSNEGDVGRLHNLDDATIEKMAEKSVQMADALGDALGESFEQDPEDTPAGTDEDDDETDEYGYQ